MLPYSRQCVDETDIAAVAGVLRSDWLTTGPEIDRFEAALAGRVAARHAVAVSSGTAALHAALFAAGVGPGDEVIVPAITFVATASAAMMLGATPVFVDVDPGTLLIDADAVVAALTPRTRAVVAVDFAGTPAPYAALRRRLAGQAVALVADACHSLGGADGDRPVGSLADLTAFSFHPVKSITSGEGGAVTTDDEAAAQRCRRFRNHGISHDHRQRASLGSWRYDVEQLGWNYRLGDMQCALARSQLRRLDAWIERRNGIADRYDAALAGRQDVRPLGRRPGTRSARHLYVIELCGRVAAWRDRIFEAMRSEGIGVNVHYRPAHLLRVFRERCRTAPGDCPVAEAAADGLLSLPCFPAMTDEDARDVIAALEKVLDAFAGDAAVAAGAS
ncbi:MAG: DegT/DnrJ/EryC1/StrS family aminotransferase [Planctomycetota bacterium]|jgi:perosamine synthetase